MEIALISYLLLIGSALLIYFPWAVLQDDIEMVDFKEAAHTYPHLLRLRNRYFILLLIGYMLAVFMNILFTSPPSGLREKSFTPLALMVIALSIYNGIFAFYTKLYVLVGAGCWHDKDNSKMWVAKWQILIGFVLAMIGLVFYII